MNDWLENLKVGDDVVVDNGQGPAYVTKVERLTKTLIFTVRGAKFRRSSGMAPGPWATVMIREPTPEVMDRVRRSQLEARRKNMARVLAQYDWHKLPIETLLAVANLLPKST